MRPALRLSCLLIADPVMAQAPQQPNLEAQRAAMKKLRFLVGKWSGEARLFSVHGEPTVLTQTEDGQFKLDGLILTIEGVGRKKPGGDLVLQAYAIISYDDASGTYRMRAFNDGWFLECDLKLTDDGQGLLWGFELGQIKTN